MYFADMDDPEAMENYMLEFSYEPILPSFDKFFDGDEEYIRLKETALG